MSSILAVAAGLAVPACTEDERPAPPQATLPESLRPGTPIRLDAATIVSVGPSTLVVEDRTRRRIEVVPRDARMLIGLAAGQRVDVDGQVKDDGDVLRVHALRIATAGAAHPRI